jgi:hypothetical protein
MPDKAFLELRKMVQSGSVNLLDKLSAECREEFESLAGASSEKCGRWLPGDEVTTAMRPC